jgi:hypothetical protein
MYILYILHNLFIKTKTKTKDKRQRQNKDKDKTKTKTKVYKIRKIEKDGSLEFIFYLFV